jgi:energy-coupling factor transporter ATP-binding protein EcfA2
MYMSRFSVKNYKCLADVDIPLTPIHVLIGPNDAGKTSVLEAMAALYASARGTSDAAFPQPWDGRELVFHGSEFSTVSFSGEWHDRRHGDSDAGTPALRYGLSVEFFPSRGKSCSSGGKWVELGGKPLDVTLLPGSPSDLIGVLARAVGRDPQLSDRVDEVVKMLKPAHMYSLNPKLMALPAAPQIRRKFRLDQDGFGLATLLQDIVNFNPNLLVSLRDKFCGFFPQFKTVRLETENACARHYDFDAGGIPMSSGSVGVGIYFETPSGETVRAQQASDGAIVFLAFLALAHLPDPPTLLLIEEPENGIYPKRLGEVIQMLKEMVNRTEGVRFPQIIMTTHSPYVLSFFEPEEVTFLSRDPKKPEAGVRARPLRDAPNIRERLGGGAFYLGELWYNLSEEEMFGEP